MVSTDEQKRCVVELWEKKWRRKKKWRNYFRDATHLWWMQCNEGIYCYWISILTIIEFQSFCMSFMWRWHIKIPRIAERNELAREREKERGKTHVKFVCLFDCFILGRHFQWVCVSTNWKEMFSRSINMFNHRCTRSHSLFLFLSSSCPCSACTLITSAIFFSYLQRMKNFKWHVISQSKNKTNLFPLEPLLKHKPPIQNACSNIYGHFTCTGVIQWLSFAVDFWLGQLLICRRCSVFSFTFSFHFFFECTRVNDITGMQKKSTIVGISNIRIRYRTYYKSGSNTEIQNNTENHKIKINFPFE